MPTRLRQHVTSRRVTVTDARGRLRTMRVVLPIPVPKVPVRHGKHTETGVPYGTGADIPEETWQEFVQAQEHGLGLFTAHPAGGVSSGLPSPGV